MQPINPHNQPGIYKRMKPADRKDADRLANYLAIHYIPDWTMDVGGINRKHDVIAVVKWLSLVCKIAMLIPIGSAVIRTGIYSFMDEVHKQAKDYLDNASIR